MLPMPPNRWRLRGLLPLWYRCSDRSTLQRPLHETPPVRKLNRIEQAQLPQRARICAYVSFPGCELPMMFCTFRAFAWTDVSTCCRCTYEISKRIVMKDSLVLF